MRLQELPAQAGGQPQQAPEDSADAASLLRRRRAGLARLSSRDSIATDADGESDSRWKLLRGCRVFRRSWFVFTNLSSDQRQYLMLATPDGHAGSSPINRTV